MGHQYVDVGLPTSLKAGFDPSAPPQMGDDGYPAIIQDQRHAYGVETVDEVETYWLNWLDQRGIEPHTNDPFDEVDAYINRARLLADCPACNSGAFVWNRNPLGCCLDCGLLFKVRFPAGPVLSAAIRLLAVRELVNCNWDAHKGETVADLERENRWCLGETTTVRNGLVVPVGLSVPDALARYVDPKVAQ